MTDLDSLRSLYEDRQLMFDVLDNLHLGVIAFNPDGRPSFVNQTLANLLKLPLKGILKGDISHGNIIFHSSATRREIFDACLNGETVVCPAHLVASDGEKIPVNVRVIPLHNKQGQIGGIVGIFRDERKQLILERSQQEYTHILDSINTALVAIDADGVITTCNKAAAHFWGTEPQLVVGEPVSEILKFLGVKRSFLMESIKHNKSISIAELPYEIHDREYLIALDCAPLTDEEGNITGAVALWRDITMQRFYEQEANRADKLAVVGELAAGIAHEIRNPLTSVRGFIQLLKRRFAGDAPEQEYLEIMLDELDRANEIVNHLLVLAKPHNPKLQLQDINYLLDELLKLIEGQALMSDVELVRQFHPEIPLMVVETGAIKQVFLNLMQNAIQAMPSGGKLTVVTDYSSEGNQNIIKIIDTGVGIPAHQLDKLGRPFFTTKKGGTGLGLMVSYKIIENHNGTVEVTSQENVGTTFTIKLPLINV